MVTDSQLKENTSYQYGYYTSDYGEKVEDCPGFETFGADVKAAREAKRLARKTLAEMVGIEWRLWTLRTLTRKSGI